MEDGIKQAVIEQGGNIAHLRSWDPELQRPGKRPRPPRPSPFGRYAAGGTRSALLLPNVEGDQAGGVEDEIREDDLPMPLFVKTPDEFQDPDSTDFFSDSSDNREVFNEVTILTPSPRP